LPRRFFARDLTVIVAPVLLKNILFGLRIPLPFKNERHFDSVQRVKPAGLKKKKGK
jgi:hypothetical protein